jgi:hypothetical protein
MAALAGKICRGFLEIASMIGPRTILDQHFGQIAAVGGSRREQGRKTANLDCVGIRPVGEQQPDRFRIPRECDGGVQGLIALRVARDRVDLCAVLQKHISGLGGAETRAKMEGCPAISAKSMAGARIGGQDVLNAENIPYGRGLEYIEKDSPCGQLR